MRATLCQQFSSGLLAQVLQHVQLLIKLLGSAASAGLGRRLVGQANNGALIKDNNLPKLTSKVSLDYEFAFKNAPIPRQERLPMLRLGEHFSVFVGPP